MNPLSNISELNLGLLQEMILKYMSNYAYSECGWISENVSDESPYHVKLYKEIQGDYSDIDFINTRTNAFIPFEVARKYIFQNCMEVIKAYEDYIENL